MLIIAGIVTLLSSRVDSRGSLISQYNAAVSAWPALRPSFAGQAFSLSVSSVTTPLSFTSSFSDFPSVESGDGISTSTAAKAAFVASGTTALSAAGTSTSAFILTLTSLGNPNNSSSITYYPQFTTTSRPCSSGNSNSQCTSRCLPGTLTSYSSSQPANAVCTTYYLLTAACLVVDPGSGMIDSSGRGCLQLSSDTQRASSDSTTGRDTRYGNVGPFNYRASSASSSSFSPSIMVRSRADPWVVALRVTDGSLSFGMTVEAKQGAGGGLLASGVVYTILVVFCIGFAIKRCGTSKRNGGAVISSGVPGVAVFPPQAQPYSISPQGQGQVMYAMPVGYPQQPQVQYAASYPQAQPAVGYPQQAYAQPQYPQQAYPQQQAYAQPQAQPAVGYPQQTYAQPQYPQQQAYPQQQEYAQQQVYAQQQAYAQQQQAYPQAYPPQQGGYPPKQL